MNNKGWAVLGVLAGIVFFVVGYIYATHSAGTLPTMFPGYLSGSTHVHTKHSIAAFVVGIACFIFAWFKSGSKAI